MGFLIFLFFIFNPFNFSEENYVNLDTLEREILNYVDVDVQLISLNLNDRMAVGDCFYFIPNADANLKDISVKDEDGIDVNAKYTGGRVYIEKRKDFYYIYSSEEFFQRSANDVGCDFLIEGGGGDFVLGLSISQNLTSKKKLFQLKEDYVDNYEDLKEQLNLPLTEEFVFNVRDTVGNPIIGVDRKIPNKIGVLARDIPIQIVHPNGSFQYGIINIRTW